MITTESIFAGLSTAMSENILTWQQMFGEESASNMLSILKETFQEREK